MKLLQLRLANQNTSDRTTNLFTWDSVSVYAEIYPGTV